MLAVIGSREMGSERHKLLFAREMERWIGEHGNPDEIVSGGAQGADTLEFPCLSFALTTSPTRGALPL